VDRPMPPIPVRPGQDTDAAPAQTPPGYRHSCFRPLSERRRVQASDARSGRGACVRTRAIGTRGAPASVGGQQRRADCSYPSSNATAAGLLGVLSIAAGFGRAG
jgi:hypothetical protein